MHRIILIPDHPGPNRDVVPDLPCGWSCEIEDLYADDHSAKAVDRFRRVLPGDHGSAPLPVLLRKDSSRARLFGFAFDASSALRAPFDRAHLPRVIEATVELPPPMAVRIADVVPGFFTAVFVPDRPITLALIDDVTQAIRHALADTGIRHRIKAVRRFDDAIHQRCLLVVGITIQFAMSIGLGAEAEAHCLTRAALLHECDKIHVPAGILNNPGKRDADEMVIVRLHPEKGEAGLAGPGFEPDPLALVHSSHEMLDGSSHPDKLKEPGIPHVLELATVYDIVGAWSGHRSCKPTMRGNAAHGIRRNGTTRPDPVLVNAFQPVATSFAPTLAEPL